MAAQENMVPVTILTGFLGSGKTTLINRVLKEQHGHRIAVIENEFGEAGVDNEILLSEAGEQIIEMNNGCVCCTVRGDLIRILGELKERRDSGKLKFERVIIETTGMADPGPVAQSFFIDEKIGNYYLLDSVITMVDAKHASKQLDEFHEAQEQVGFADRILMSKTDLVSEAEQEGLRKRLAKMNPRAPIKTVHFGNTPIEDILDIRGFNLSATLELDPEFLEDSEHEHDEHVSSFAFRSDKPFDSAKLEEFLSGVVQIYGPDMLRYKGVLYMKGNTHRVVFQGVHMLMGGDLGRACLHRQESAAGPIYEGIGTMFGGKAVKKLVGKAAKPAEEKPAAERPAAEKPAKKNGLSEAELLRAPASQYMSPEQLAFFRERLLETQKELLEKADLTSEHLREHEIEADPTDQATIEEEYALELRARDRERKLLKKIDEALRRIEDGSYGYCEETGEPIGIPRLIARPTATLSIEAQSRREQKQKLYGE